MIIDPLDKCNTSYTYKDIGIRPNCNKPSEIESRESVSLNRYFGYHSLKLPVLSAPMEKVTGPRLASILCDFGGLPVFYRTKDFKHDLEKVKTLPETYYDKIMVSVGITGDYLERVEEYFKLGVRSFCIDVANGHNILVGQALEKIQDHVRQVNTPTCIISGNVASFEGFRYLSERGCNGVRVGIGGGSACLTSVTTGIGIGQASLVSRIAQDRYFTPDPERRVLYRTSIIADGGIREPGDVFKALALGADLVMIGGMFAGTTEAEGEIHLSKDGQLWKTFAGQASGAIKDKQNFIEGASGPVKVKGSIVPILQSIKEGLQSALAYVNLDSLVDMLSYHPYTVEILSHAAQQERQSNIGNL